jgi:hypothetical protein
MKLDHRSLQPSLITQSKEKEDERVEEPAAHLVPLPGGDWKLWRWAGLRGAGFPAAQVRALSAEDCSRAADELLLAEGEVERTHEQALTSIRDALDALRRDGQWEDAARRKPLVNALRSLTKGKAPAQVETTAEVLTAVESFTDASARREAAQAAFVERFGEDVIRLSQSLYEVARSSRFHEAVVWQNRNAFHTAILPFLRQSSEADGAGRKKHKEMIASYLQRYCVKNDTIGFFGPVGWARFVQQGEALEARPGAGLLATRHVYFETWCMDALADKLSANKALRPWIVPRRVPYLYLNGTMLSVPRCSRPLSLPRTQAAAIQLCDGHKTAKEIVLTLTQTFPSEVKSEGDGYELLEQLRAKWLIMWKLEIPTGLFPERTLRQAVERIEDEGLRAEALEDLDELERGRAAVVEAAGDAERLDRAMADMDESFTRMSGRTSTRAAGEMYAARTLVYEDCRRDLEVDIGPDILSHLGPPLSLLLAGARWYTSQTAKFYRTAFARIYDELARLQGSREVSWSTFWYHAQPLIMDEDKNAGHFLRPIFQQHWAEILSLPEGQRRVHYTVEQLRPLFREHFGTPDAGWPTACYHSPDVMIAASDAEAIRRGDYQLVLGEFHIGSNTLRTSLFVAQHPRQEDLYRAIEADWPADSLRLATPKTWPNLTSRTAPALNPRSNPWALFTHDSLCPPETEKVLEISSFVVMEAGGQLRVMARDAELSYDIIEAFADAFHTQMIDGFKMLGVMGHTPRITIDRLIVTRESWAYAPDEISFAYVKDDAERFLKARRWAHERRMPRFVFAKSPVETKPIYVDFNSPVYVDILAKVVRRTAESDQTERPIVVSEMLPAHDQLWMADADGQRYTSEFRIVALNP